MIILWSYYEFQGIYNLMNITLWMIMDLDFFLFFISECRFSDKRYELEDTWHPDLGPPFGVMYCVHCECVAVRIKNLVFQYLILFIGKSICWLLFVLLISQRLPKVLSISTKTRNIFWQRSYTIFRIHKK